MDFLGGSGSRSLSIGLKTILWIGLGLALGRCASYTEETREMRSFYQGGAYGEALKVLDASSLKTESRNRVLYQMERGSILERLERRPLARTAWILADQISDELYTVSVSSTAASFVVNDAMGDYEGEDYEKVALHTQLALSFLSDGDLGGARVSARKINSKLQVINQQHGDDKSRYKEDAFAYYLSGMIYEARQEWDSALIDYGRAVKAYQGDFAPYARGAPPELVLAYDRLLQKRGRSDRRGPLLKEFPKLLGSQGVRSAVPAGWGEVAVVHQVGRIAVKRSESFVTAFGKHLVRFSFPVISASSGWGFGATGFEWSQGNQRESKSGVLAADFDAIARQCLDDRRLRLIAKSAARLIAKGQFTEKATEQFGVVGWLVGNIYSVATETADTRGWTLLPAAYFVTRTALPPGKHGIKILTQGRVMEIKTVEVKPDGLVLVTDQG